MIFPQLASERSSAKRFPTIMSLSAPDILKQHTHDVAGVFEKLIASLETAPKKLLESIVYSFNAGGKRLRPALLLESFTACGASEDDRPTALLAACAIELIHTFSLVHDDLPAMDDDDLRRGQPTNHKVFGEAMAILAGDAMVTLAFELLSQASDPILAVGLVKELSGASGPVGMVGGQVLDIDGEHQRLDQDQLMQVHRMKTGALLTGACRMGAVAARATPAQLETLTRFGQHLGLAFQIIDDVLDVTSTPEQLGKATQKDAEKGKNTYPALLGIDRSRAMAKQELSAALDALSCFGGSADGLRTLAGLVIERTR